MLLLAVLTIALYGASGSTTVVAKQPLLFSEASHHTIPSSWYSSHSRRLLGYKWQTGSDKGNFFSIDFLRKYDPSSQSQYYQSSQKSNYHFSPKFNNKRGYYYARKGGYYYSPRSGHFKKLRGSFRAPAGDSIEAPTGNEFDQLAGDGFGTHDGEEFNTRQDDGFNTPSGHGFNRPNGNGFHPPIGDDFHTPSGNSLNSPRGNDFDPPGSDIPSGNSFQETSRPGCGSLSTINDLRSQAGKPQISYSKDLESMSCRLNNQCGFDHSCAEAAEILYRENGYSDDECHVARAVEGWKGSPGHYRIATGDYSRYGCCSTPDGPNETIRRCSFQ